jgi:hypothetical protein
MDIRDEFYQLSEIYNVKVQACIRGKLSVVPNTKVGPRPTESPPRRSLINDARKGYMK